MDHLSPQFSQESSQFSAELAEYVASCLDSKQLICFLRSTRSSDYIRGLILVRGIELVIGTHEDLRFLRRIVNEGLNLHKSSISFRENIRYLVTGDMLAKLAGAHIVLLRDEGIKFLAPIHKIEPW